MEESLAKLSSTLKAHHYSLTSPRKTVFVALLDKEPQTMGQLAKTLAGTVDRASVYRIIALFEQLGIVERLQMGWKYKLELSDAFSAHHHHLTCTNCGAVSSFEESPVILHELKAIADNAGFSETGHQLEIRGICRLCRPNQF